MKNKLHTFIEESLNKQEYRSNNDFVNYITTNSETLFSKGMFNAGQSRIKSEIDFLYLKFTNPEKYVNGIEVSNFYESLPFIDFENNIKTDESSITPISLEINSVNDYIPAFKEILWHFSNIPMTQKNILRHIVKVSNNGSFEHISTKDYPVTNVQFQKAINDFLLKLTKEKINGKWVYLYSNPTNKRQGFYYQGKLLSLKELSSINNVPVITIKKRLSKGMPVHKAIIK